MLDFFVGKSEWPADYMEEKTPKYNKLDTRHIKNNSYLILDYRTKTKAYYKIEVNDVKRKNVVTIEIEYNVFVNEEKKKAQNLMNELLESLKFK